MASIKDVEAGNPNIREQLRVWREERVKNAEDPYRWDAFRVHVIAIGAPDPGVEEFDEFRTPD